MLVDQSRAHAVQSAAHTGKLTETAVAEAIASVDVAEVGISTGLPGLFFLDYALPPVDWATLLTILPYAIVLAGVGLIESLMALRLIGQSLINVHSGGRGRTSGSTAAVCFLLFVLFLAP